MAAWDCPECGRRFARTNQGHECAPAMSIEEYFAHDPGHERPVFDAVMAHMKTVGPVHVEPVSVGIFLKRPRKFAELRTMRKWVALSMSLPKEVQHRTLGRKVIPYGGRYWHVFNIASPDDIDDDIKSFLTQAYVDAS